jgi:hypothetical protein
MSNSDKLLELDEKKLSIKSGDFLTDFGLLIFFKKWVTTLHILQQAKLQNQTLLLGL